MKGNSNASLISVNAFNDLDSQVSLNTSDISDLQSNKQDNLTQEQLDAVNSGIDSEKVDQISTNAENIATNTQNISTNTDNISNNTNAIDAINAKIPAEATSNNQLADKDFVNSSIATNTANFIGTFNTVTELQSYSGTVTNNDYAFVQNQVLSTDYVSFAALDAVNKATLTNYDYGWVINAQDNTKFDLYRFDIINQQWDLRVEKTDKDQVTLNTAYNRYKAVVASNIITWTFEYTLNNSSFTAAQWAAINSGITSGAVDQISTNATDISAIEANYVTTNTAQTITAEKTFSDTDISLSNSSASGSASWQLEEDIYGQLAISRTYNGTKSRMAQFNGNNLLPEGNNGNLGSISKKWQDLYLSRDLTDGTNSVSVADITTIQGNYVTKDTDQEISGVKTIKTDDVNNTGTVKFGDTSGYHREITVGSAIQSDYYSDETTKVKTNWADYGNNFQLNENLVPWTDDTFDLGSSTNQWQDIYLKGNLTDGTNSINVSNIVNKVINVIPGSEILNDTLTEAQWNIITNGRPTQITGSLTIGTVTLLNPLILYASVRDNDNYVEFYLLGAKAVQDTYLYEGTVTYNTRAITLVQSLHWNGATFDIARLRNVNSKQFPSYPSDTTKKYILQQNQTSGDLSWQAFDVDDTINVINASDIVNNTFNADQKAIVTNGKPTAIKGTFLTMKNPVIVSLAPNDFSNPAWYRGFICGSNDGNSNYSLGLATMYTCFMDTNGGINITNEPSVCLPKAGIKILNGKTLPDFPSDLTTSYVLKQNITSGTLEWSAINGDIVDTGSAQTISGLKTFSEINFKNPYQTIRQYIDGSNYLQIDYGGYRNGWFIGSGEFSPSDDNKNDIGRTTRRIKNLYIAGNLTDGTNSVSVADIAGKQDALDATQLAAVNSGIDTTLVTQIGTNQTDISTINEKIPSAASSSNQLADKAYVSSSISTSSATFRGSYNLVTDLGLTINASHSDVATALGTVIASADNNDYAFVEIPSTSYQEYDGYSEFDSVDDYVGFYVIYNSDYTYVTDSNKSSLDITAGTTKAYTNDLLRVDRYKYVEISGGTSYWDFEYTLNNSGFTAAQWAAINSGVTDSNYVTTNTAQTISGEKTFSNGLKVDNYTIDKDAFGQLQIRNANTTSIQFDGDYVRAKNLVPIGNNSRDLGSSGQKWKDLYLAGNLTDGTNSIAIADLANKNDVLIKPLTLTSTTLSDDQYNLILNYDCILTADFNSLSYAKKGTILTKPFEYNNTLRGMYITENKIGTYLINMTTKEIGNGAQDIVLNQIASISSDTFKNGSGSTYLQFRSNDVNVTKDLIANSGANSLGTSTYKWKDLYLSGDLKDGTNSIAIQDISSKTYVNNKTPQIVRLI